MQSEAFKFEAPRYLVDAYHNELVKFRIIHRTPEGTYVTERIVVDQPLQYISLNIENVASLEINSGSVSDNDIKKVLDLVLHVEDNKPIQK